MRNELKHKRRIFMNWIEYIPNQTYLGDIYDIHHRRMVVIINNGVAVALKCSIEEEHLMLKDFLNHIGELDFFQIGRVEKNIPVIFQEYEHLIMHDFLEEITLYLLKSMKKH